MWCFVLSTISQYGVLFCLQYPSVVFCPQHLHVVFCFVYNLSTYPCGILFFRQHLHVVLCFIYNISMWCTVLSTTYPCGVLFFLQHLHVVLCFIYNISMWCTVLSTTFPCGDLFCRGVGCIFTEMISGSATFPGMKDAYDQLDKIFRVCYIDSIAFHYFKSRIYYVINDF